MVKGVWGAGPFLLRMSSEGSRRSTRARKEKRLGEEWALEREVKRACTKTREEKPKKTW